MIIRLYVRAMGTINRLKSQKKGQTLVEYGLILALVALVVIAAVTALGGQLKNLFSKVTAQLT